MWKQKINKSFFQKSHYIEVGNKSIAVTFLTNQNQLFILQNQVQLIILMVKDWKYELISFDTNKIDCSSERCNSVFLVYNSHLPKLKFRAEVLIQKTLDILKATMIDETGNNLQLDEFSIKQTIKILNENHKLDFKGAFLSSDDGYLKILLKNKYMISFPPNSKHQFLMTTHYQPFIEKLVYILNVMSYDLTKCLKMMESKKFNGLLANDAFLMRLTKQIKTQEITLANEIGYTLKMKNQEITEYLRKVRKMKKESSQNSLETSASSREELVFDSLDKFQESTGYPSVEEQQKSNLHEIMKIQLQEECLKRKFGGACEIQKRKAKVIQFMKDGKRQLNRNKLVAMKKAKQTSDQAHKILQCHQRFKREKKILCHIAKSGKKTYLLDYYYLKDRDDILYADYLHLNLHQFIYFYRQGLTTNEILSICKQIMQIIYDLHECGIVHRDIKMSNFLVDTSRGIQLKLIDFSDSWFINDIPKDQKLCGTLPFSPLQTSKHNKYFEQNGINKPSIDYWSAGIIIHEIFYGSLPLTFSPCMAKDIHSLWSNEFLSVVKGQKKNGLKLIQNGFQLINVLLVRVVPEERSFGKAYLILCGLEKYYKNFMKLMT